MIKFWDWVTDETGHRTLRLDGPIDNEMFWGDEITPQAFRSDLMQGKDAITVYINSPGGNVFAAAEIYTMLLEYPSKVTVKIESLAASAASVIAMAGDEVLMSPVSLMMIHDPSTIAMGNVNEMKQAIIRLKECKETLLNAYELKVNGKTARSTLATLMENETWLNAEKAIDFGLADGLITRNDDKGGEQNDNETVSKAKTGIYSNKAMAARLINRLTAAVGSNEKKSAENGAIPFNFLSKQLDLIKTWKNF